MPALFPALFSSALYQFACKLDEFSFKLHGKIEGQNREADADEGSEGFSVKAMSEEFANRALKTKHPNIFQFLLAFTEELSILRNVYFLALLKILVRAYAVENQMLPRIFTLTFITFLAHQMKTEKHETKTYYRRGLQNTGLCILKQQY